MIVSPGIKILGEKLKNSMSQKNINNKDITKKDGVLRSFCSVRDYDYPKPSKGASSIWAT